MPLICNLNNSFKTKNIIVKESQSLAITDNDFQDSSSIIYKIIVEKSVHFDLSIVLMNIKSAEIEIELDLRSNNSSADITFLYALSLDQNIRFITKQKHTGKETISRLFARGIVKDIAQIQHEGLIVIGSQAQQSDALLNHTAIVLDGKAQVVLIPSIEVLNNDVQCSHGAAVGQFDQEQLWYLKTRGLDEKKAYQVLAQSFFKEFIEYFDQPERVLENLCQKIL